MCELKIISYFKKGDFPGNGNYYTKLNSKERKDSMGTAKLFSVDENHREQY